MRIFFLFCFSLILNCSLGSNSIVQYAFGADLENGPIKDSREIFKAAQKTEKSDLIIAKNVAGKALLSNQQIFSSYQKLLTKHVDIRGRVNYKALLDKKSKLDEIAESLKLVNISEGSSDNWRKAFWINVYNFLCLKTVIDNYPLEKENLNPTFPKNSIRQVPGAFTGLKYEIASKIVTLDYILHQVFRSEFMDTRLLFVINNASLGAAKLSKEIYVEQNLDRKLDSEVKYFLVNPSKFYFDKKERRILASPIFKWYKKDFIKHYNVDFKSYTRQVANYLGFISKYISAQDVELIKSRYFKFTYLEYDWSLNEKFM